VALTTCTATPTVRLSSRLYATVTRYRKLSRRSSWTCWDRMGLKSFKTIMNRRGLSTLWKIKRWRELWCRMKLSVEELMSDNSIRTKYSVRVTICQQ